MAIFNNSIIPAGAAAAAAGDVVTKSLRCDSASSAYLIRTPSSTSATRTKWVFSTWVKRSRLGYAMPLYQATAVDGSDIATIHFGADDRLEIAQHSSGYVSRYLTERVFRDPAAFYHITVVFDSTAAEADRVKLYVNGVLETAWNIETRVGASATWSYGTGVGHMINNMNHTSAVGGGYHADVYWLDGTVTLPSGYTNWYDVFAEEDSTTGQWKPKATSGLTFGTNGFHLTFDSEDGQVFALQSDAVDGNTTFTDLSQHTHAITANGNAEHSTDVSDPAAGSKSSMYFDGTGDYLSSTDAKDVANLDNSDWTLELWVRPTIAYGSADITFLGSGGGVAGWNATNGHSWTVWAGGGASDVYFQYWTGSTYTELTYSNTDVPINTWTHIAVVNQSGTKRMYIGGVQRDTNSTAKGTISTPSVFVIGNDPSLGGPFEGYIHNVSIQRDFCKYKDGTTFTPSTSPVTALSADIGFDSSSNGNHWDATNLDAASDVMEDTPTDNYCTMNPLDTHSSNVLSEGNLNFSSSGTAGHYPTFSTMGMRSGKWYWEASRTGGGNWIMAIMSLAHDSGSLNMDSTVGNSTSSVNKVGYSISASTGNKSHDYGSEYNLAYGSAIGTGGVLMCAFDADNGKIWWGKDGTWFGSGDPANGTNAAFTGIDTDTDWGVCIHCYSGHLPWMNFGADPTFGGNVSTPDTSEFKHTPPTGFKSLSTGNLPTPTIAKPSEHFSTKLYSGTGNTTQNITGVGFQPDLVWIKNRNTVMSHYLLDSVRGLYKLNTESTSVEGASTNRFNSFDTDGFQVEHSGGGGGFTNGASQTYAAWNWLAEDGFEAVSGVSDSGSKNVDAGFSIVTWTGNDSGGFSPTPQSVSHGLTVAPELIIAKQRTANGMGNGSWVVWTKDLSSGTYLIMNTTAGEASWSDALVSSIDDSSVSFGSDISGNGEDLNADSFGGADTYVGYLFATVAGHSKVGLYNGNSADNFVALDFAPAWILIKSTGNPSSSGHWVIKDNKRSAAYNPADGNLYANATYAEDTTASVDIDLLSNGFNIQGTYAGINATSSSYIFLAMAEKPLKYASAR